MKFFPFQELFVSLVSKIKIPQRLKMRILNSIIPTPETMNKSFIPSLFGVNVLGI